MNPYDEFEALQKFADAARDKGSFSLANLYDELARCLLYEDPETCLKALRRGLYAVLHERW